MRIICVFSVCIFTAACSKSSAQTADAKAPKDGFQEMMEMANGKWETATLGPWECQVPAVSHKEVLTCTLDGKMVFNAIGAPGQGALIGVPEDARSSSFISVRVDSSGAVKDLSYDGLSNAGELVRHVEDRDVDGQPDRIVDFRTHAQSVRINGQMLDLTKIGLDESKRVVYTTKVDGVEKRVLLDRYPFPLEDLPTHITPLNE
ncbi:hypothetical protein FNZ56_08445 [Pseudoluteimonas lycopersici]|uniref:Uncharacterized protein n=1 Tax=Pseudoluteimonas lycopersici TaxID=1324796 RepID=A0A516V5Y1_9GAMM|nr:hypothetical protein FNZ56_08445 [Lysobacter lycopersici]